MKNYLLILAAFLVISCKTIKPTTTPVGVFDKLPEKKESQIILPFYLPIGELQTFVNEKFPNGEIASGSFNEGDLAVNYSVKRNDPIVVRLDGSTIRISTSLNCSAHGCVRECIGIMRKGKCIGPWATKCGDAGANATLEVTTNISIDENYNIIPVTNVSGNVDNARFYIGILGFNVSINIRDLVSGVLSEKINKFNNELNEKIREHLNKFKLRSLVADKWKTLGNPYSLGNLFLEISPRKLYLDNIGGNGNSIIAKLGVGADLSITDTKPEIHKDSLPKLGKLTNLNGGFDIDVPVSLTYDFLTSLVNNEIKNRKFVDKDSLYELTVRKVLISGIGNQILLRVDFKAGRFKRWIKNVNGYLYFTAQPAYDPKSNKFFVQDFKLTVESNKIIVDKGLPWLSYNFYYDKIKEKLVYCQLP